MEEEVKPEITEETSTSTGTEESPEIPETGKDFPEDSPEDSSEATTEAEEVLSEADISTAKQLYKALQDPKRGKEIIAGLAKSMGLELGTSGKPESTKPEKTVQEKDTGKAVSIADIVKNNLPVSMQPLAPALTKVFEEINAQVIESRFKELNAGRVNEKAEAAISYGEGKYKDWSRVYPIMEKLAPRFQPGDLKTQTDYNEYVDDLYALAKAKAGDTLNTQDTLKNLLNKHEKNVSRAKPSPSSGGQEMVTSAKTIQEAIDAAMKSLAK